MYLKSSFIFLFLASIAKLFAVFYTEFDLFGDESQYWIWSKSLDFGYYSKPPLLSWVIAGVSYIFGDSFETLKLIPFIFYFFTSYSVFLLTNELFKNNNLSILSGLSFYLLPATSVSSFLISTDVILLFFWSLTLLILLKIRKNPCTLNFVLLGIFLGLSFLAKYAAIYFILCLLIFIYNDKKIKIVFLKNIFQVLFFVFCFFAVIFPNIVWNFNNDWLTLTHTSDNAALDRIRFDVLNFFEFIVTQGVMLGPTIFIYFLLTIKKVKLGFENKFLLIFSLPIFIVVLAESFLVRANANWAAVALIPFFIMIINHIYNYSKKIIFVNNLVNFIICTTFFLLIATTSELRIFDRVNGVSEFSETIKDKHMKYVRYLVVEDRLLYSNLNFYFKDTDIKFYTNHPPKNKITSHFHLSNPLPEFFNKKFVFIGNISNLNYLKNKKFVKKIDETNALFSKQTIEVYEVSF